MSIKQTGNLHPFKDVAKKLDREITLSLEKVGVGLEKEAKRRVPVDTGRLQRSISRIVTTFSSGLRLVFGSGVTGSTPKYAPYIEYGTKFIQAIPFLRSTLSDKKPWIERAISAGVRRAFK